MSSHFLRERNTDHKAIPRTKKHDFLCAGKDICNKMLLDATYIKFIINKNDSILGFKTNENQFLSNPTSK